jgi:alpha-glucuronidase
MKSQVVCYIDLGVFNKLLRYMQENAHKTGSQAINHILHEYFKGIDEQDQAVSRLNTVIQKLEDEKNRQIKELEHQLQHGKILKEV